MGDSMSTNVDETAGKKEKNEICHRMLPRRISNFATRGWEKADRKVCCHFTVR